MEPCLHPGTLGTNLTIAEFLGVAADVGFAFVEMTARRMLNCGDIESLLSEKHVTPVCCNWSIGLRVSREDFDIALLHVEEEMAFTASCGCRGGALLLPFRNEPHGYIPGKGDTMDRIVRIANIAARYRLNVFLEFLGLHVADAPRDSYHDLQATIALVDQMGQANVGVLLDSYHWYLSGSTVEDVAVIPHDVPLFVHINDAPPGDVRALDDSMRLLPGGGVIDLDGFLGALAARRYNGPVSVEVF